MSDETRLGSVLLHLLVPAQTLSLAAFTHSIITSLIHLLFKTSSEVTKFNRSGE